MRLQCLLLPIGLLVVVILSGSAGANEEFSGPGSHWMDYHRSEFSNLTDPFWSQHPRQGSISIINGIWVRLSTPNTTTRAPWIERMNGFSGDGGRLFPLAGNFRVTIRFRYAFPSGLAGYGVDIWAGLASCGFSDPQCRHFNIYMHRDLGFRARLLPKTWTDELRIGGTDTATHILEVWKTGDRWRLWIDGTLRLDRTNTGTHPDRPDILVLGDFTVQCCAAKYPTLDVDYVDVDSDVGACIANIQPPSPQLEGTNVTVSAQAWDGAGLGSTEFLVNSASDGSSSGQWWSFATANLIGAYEANPQRTLGWGQAPGWMPRTGSHLIVVRLYDPAGNIRRDWNWDGCASRAYTWLAPTPTPTATPTATATPTRTPTPVPTPTPSPSQFTLEVDYPWLVYYGPELGLPAQTLRGEVLPPPPPGSEVRITVQQPDGTEALYLRATDEFGKFLLDPAAANDPMFGAIQIGMWQAELESGLSSNSVGWEVRWFPVHLTE